MPFFLLKAKDCFLSLHSTINLKINKVFLLFMQLNKPKGASQVEWKGWKIVCTKMLC
jgi:hypothetical protein